MSSDDLQRVSRGGWVDGGVGGVSGGGGDQQSEITF